MPRKAQNNGLWRKKDASGNPVGSWFLPIFVDGKKYIRSTETEDLAEAKKKIPYLVSTLMRELGRNESRTDRREWSLETAFEMKVADLRLNGASEATIENYHYAFAPMFSFFGKSKLIQSFTTEEIQTFANVRLQSAKKSTVSKQLNTFLAAMRFAKERGAFAGNPKELIPKNLRNVEAIRHRFLSASEIELLVQDMRKSKRAAYMADYVLAYIYLGASLSELFKIRVSHVDFANRRVLIEGTKTRARSGTVPIIENLLPILQARCEGKKPSDLVFEPKPSIRNCFVAFVRRAGLPHATIHDLRRTTGSLLASNGANLVAIASVLRHSNIATTSKHYAHLTPGAQMEALSMLNQIGAKP